MDISGPTGVGGPGHIEPNKPVENVNKAEKAEDVQSTRSADKVEISDAAKISDQGAFVDNLKAIIKDIPDIRADRVAEIRSQIENGTYETEAKINQAIDNLLDEIG